MVSKLFDRFYRIFDGNFFRGIYLSILYIILYAPILILMLASFNADRRMSGIGNFTMKWYVELFQDERILRALYNTIFIAVVAALVSTIIGTFAAYGIYHYKRKWLKKSILAVNNLPVINPDIVTGVSLMVWFAFFFKSIFGIRNGMFTLLIAHITFCIPYVVLSVLPKLKQMQKDTIEAAMDLGANSTQAFFKVVLPEIMSGVISGLMIAFTLSIDDFVISFFTTGGGVQNLSITIYSMTKKGISPKINALSTLMFVVVFVMMLIINRKTKIEDL